MRRQALFDFLYGSISINPTIQQNINFEKLKTTLTAAINYYIKTIKESSKNVVGFFQSDDEINRAFNLLRYLSIIDDANHFALLALLISVFESTSTWLTICISEALIYSVHSSYPLDSEVISLKLIEKSINHALIPIAISDLGFFYIYNKIMGVIFILSEIQNKITDASEKKTLACQVQLFKNKLTQDPEFFDPDSVSACEMKTYAK